MPHTLWGAPPDMGGTGVRLHITERPAGPLGETYWESLAALGWSYGSADRVHPMQMLVLFDAAGTTLDSLPWYFRPAVERLMLPAARFMGFAAVYPGTASAMAASEGPDGGDDGDDEGHVPEIIELPSQKTAAAEQQEGSAVE